MLFDELLRRGKHLSRPRSRATGSGLIDWKKLNADAQALLPPRGADFDPTIRLRDLGIGQEASGRDRPGALGRCARLIMDEPTGRTVAQEIHELYELIERLKADGKAILFISHKIR